MGFKSLRTLWMIITAAAPLASALAQAPAQIPSFKQIDRPKEPTAIRLYSGVAPGSERWSQVERWEQVGPGARVVRNVVEPTLTPFLPAPGKANGSALVVAPGGAFMMLSIDSEGYEVAKWYADHGVAAFVLKYRLRETPADPKEYLKKLGEVMQAIAVPPGGTGAATSARTAPETPEYSLADALAALRMVRDNAGKWGIDPRRVGFVGFSAGAMTALSTALVTDVTARPDFVAPIYGPMQARDVPRDAPPLFTALAADDMLFGGGQVDLIRSWKAAGRPYELHVFERGGHGFGMNQQGSTSDHWATELLWWMDAMGYLQPKSTGP